MNTKSIYRATDVKKVNVEKLKEQIKDQELVLGIDIAKEEMRAVLMDTGHTPHINLKFKHPRESHLFMRFLRLLSPSKLSVAMEPTGTYGDALRLMFWDQSIEVYKVNPKKVHIMSEAYDGVPSIHDVKAAHIIAKMHIDGVSSLWKPKNKAEIQAESALRELSFFKKPLQQYLNHLEALLARYWPEVQGILSLDSSTLLALLVEYGGPRELAKDIERAKILMEKIGGRFLSKEKIALVLESAYMSVGVRQTQGEIDCIRTLAQEIQRTKKKARECERKIEALSQQEPSIQNISEEVGKVTAVVLVNQIGDPLQFENVRSLWKSAGLNLKEKSSGKLKGKMKITKRGSSLARQYLWLAAWRWVQKDEIVKKWFDKKVKRDRGAKGKAIVAVMRKLLAGLWHVARGEKMDVSKLFDTTRL